MCFETQSETGREAEGKSKKNDTNGATLKWSRGGHPRGPALSPSNLWMLHLG